jgi:glucose-6-phosphate 1-dehydrogenase
MIQNIIVMRFANRLLENNWSSDSISQVSIDVKETEGIGNRGEYYDSSGALKDMIQSHLLQMLALIAMEEPLSLSSEDIRKEKIKVLQKTSVQKKNAVFGQYDGYLSENRVPQDSITETFVFLKAEVNTPRWKNVPFFLTTGKKLNEKKAEIIIDFKEHSSAKKLWPNNKHTSNQLVIGISEYEGIRFQMNVKKPGLNDTVSDALLDYCHSCQKIGNNPEAYEKLLLDFIENNSTLFTSWKEIESSWNIIDHLKKDMTTPVTYKSLSDFKHIINKVKGGL